MAAPRPGPTTSIGPKPAERPTGEVVTPGAGALPRGEAITSCCRHCRGLSDPASLALLKTPSGSVATTVFLVTASPAGGRPLPPVAAVPRLMDSILVGILRTALFLPLLYADRIPSANSVFPRADTGSATAVGRGPRRPVGEVVASDSSALSALISMGVA